MNGLIEWFAKNGVAANLLAIFIAIVGVMTIGTLRQEVFPEFSSDMIYVRVVYPGPRRKKSRKVSARKSRRPSTG